MLQIKYSRSLLFLTLWCCILSCGSGIKNDSLFSIRDTASTGLVFTNKLVPTAEFNLFSYMYYYNGAGVGAGDFNNDGKIDLFFSANMRSNALFLNKGELRFEDVSMQAGIPRDSSWSTGVSVVDINNDGMLDIYVCRVANYKILKGRNSLLICKNIDSSGIPHYADEAVKYGLDFSGYSTQSVFSDFDGDGDLDMFLLNHTVNHEGNYAPRRNFENTFDSLAGHRQYRNDIVIDEKGQVKGKFIDVSRESGINSSKIGYGLGVAVSDINLDGWPDLYIGNDFHENDYLYINQRDGKFKDESEQRLMHTSQFSMGVDIADINNDAYPEIISMDMLPYNSYMLRRSPLSENDYSIFYQKIDYGYSYQYARNNLQFNRGNGKFTETGQFAGIHATDWSWSSLFMDFNNDGNKDLFVSNGIPKRMNDIDFINFVSGEEVQKKLRENSLQDKDLSLLDRFPEIKIPNQFFLNNGGLHFTNMTDSIQDNPSTFSNGAVYADLDNDGDLDIVVNNINDPVLVYENNTNKGDKTTAYASISLKGSKYNTQAIGARVFVYSGENIFTYEHLTVHGFLSSMLGPIHIGLENIKPDSVLLVWPDNSYQHLDLQQGKNISISYQPGLPKFDYKFLKSSKTEQGSLELQDITGETGVLYKHVENSFNEFDREPLIPHMVSKEGPALAIADINHDGLQDFFIGSSKTFHNAVFLQTAAGKFMQIPQPEMMKDSMWEGVDAIWQDVNQDSHPDLIIASGGNEFYGKDVHLKPLLYLNDGKGNLKNKTDAFGDIFVTQSKVLTADFNEDGFADLFIAGRVEPWKYGVSPRSYLLQNDGTGKFTDVTATYSADLVSPGMVTCAEWADINGDQKKDLILSYDWGGIDAFIKAGNKLKKKTLTSKQGWWQFFITVDLDQDGDLDLLAGNFGLNSRLKASPEKPVNLYINDFDDNGRIEQVMTYNVGNIEMPFAGKMQLEKILPYMKKKFLYAEDFAKADLKELFGAKKLDQSLHLRADCFQSMVFINQGNLNFISLPLPDLAQLSTYRTAVVVDADKDDKPDILLLGNFYPNNVEIGRMDGDFGTLLLNRGGGSFQAAMVKGFDILGEVRKVSPILIGKQNGLILARNNDSLRIFIYR